MQKLALALAVAAAVAIPGSLVSSPARADGYGYHHHHHHHWRHHHVHVWGDGDYEIIRWANGDCKIWHDDDGPPWGDGWVVVRENFPTWDAAWWKLGRLQRHGRCASW
jgi:hypothetical protein